jgi:epoxyqueuosine reductase
VSLKDDIKKFAVSQGAQLVAMASVEAYGDYLSEVEKRLQETGAELKDYMASPVENMPGSTEMSFFTQLSDARNTLPTAKTIIILGVYTYDENAIYKNTHQQLRGKTARSYSYYPVVRKIAEDIVRFLQERGHKAIHGQNIPLKFVADRIGIGAYGMNGIFQTPQYGSCIALRNILTEAELEGDNFDKPSTQCQGCQRCIKACPTGALYAPYKVNPKLCINPATRTEKYIEPQFRSKMQNWIHGCDICQEVCPANKDLIPREIDPRSGFEPSHHASHKNLDGLERTPYLIELLTDKYPEILRRNAAIALSNIAKGRTEAVTALKEQLDSVSPELKEYFTWAIEILKETTG